MTYDYDAASPRERLEAAEHNIRVLTVAQMRPGVPAHKMLIYRDLERSARVEARLRRRALDRQNPKT